MSNAARLGVFWHTSPPPDLIDMLEQVSQHKPLPDVMQVWLERWCMIRSPDEMPELAGADEIDLYDLLKPPTLLIGWLKKVKAAKGVSTEVGKFLIQWDQGEAKEVNQKTGELQFA